MTGFDDYFEGLGLTIDNDDTADQFYRVDDIIATDGGATSWRLLRLNAVLARSGFAQTQGGQNDGLIIPLKAGSPQYAFVQETMQDGQGRRQVPRRRLGSPSLDLAVADEPHERRSGSVRRGNSPTPCSPDGVCSSRAHQHNYERFEPQKADGTVDTDGRPRPVRRRHRGEPVLLGRHTAGELARPSSGTTRVCSN